MHAFCVIGQGTFWPLDDGRSEYIHYLNERALSLSDDDGNVIEYLRFFCEFLRGEGGRFLILDDAEALEWTRPVVNVQRNQLAAIKPPNIVSKAPDGSWEDIDAFLIHSNELHRVRFRVQLNTGEVTEQEGHEKVIASDLPIVEDTTRLSRVFPIGPYLLA